MERLWAHKNPWTVRRDTKSDSYLIDFSYRDEHGTLRRFRRSAGRGVGKREEESKARRAARMTRASMIAPA